MEAHAKKQKGINSSFSTFFIISILYLLLQFFNNNYIYSKQLYLNLLIERIPFERAEEMAQGQYNLLWTGYLITPVVLLIKFLVISGLLGVGLLINNNSFKFKELFRLTMFAEAILFIQSLIKYTWMAIIIKKFTLEDINFFSPLSLTNIIQYKHIDTIWLYSLQTINVFEFIYIIILSIGIAKIISGNFWQAFRLTVISYGSGLILWILIVTFISINLTS